jgi:uncharacterized protein
MRTKASLILILLLTVTTSAAFAADSDSTPGRTIVVDGNGEAHAAPDWATINLAIETQGHTAAAAAQSNAALAQKVVDALKAKLGDQGTITTGGYSLNPEYDQRPNRERPDIVGYTAQNSITVETGALDLVGPLIDSSIAAGANRVNYLNFSLKNDTKARDEAIANATKDARAQADALASALGVRLGQVIKATTAAQVTPIRVSPMPMMAMAKMNQPTPIEAGQISIPATVSLTYEIE